MILVKECGFNFFLLKKCREERELRRREMVVEDVKENCNFLALKFFFSFYFEMSYFFIILFLECFLVCTLG